MSGFLGFTVVGIVTGSVYALTATGLVVTYVTSGIFNFAHGAIGMIAAFAYWQLTVKDHWPVILAMPFVVFVLAPILGVLIDVVVMRNLHEATQEVRVIVTVGVMLFLLGVGQWIWKPTAARILPQLFLGHQVKFLGVVISYHQLTMIAAAVIVAAGLRLFLFRTRPGVALRAVVDAPDLASLFGAAPARVRATGWAIGASLAALSGILLAPLVTLDHLILTLLVINGYAASIVGRLKSLPLTFLGGIALGLFEAYVVGYAPGKVLNQLKPTLPIIFLYIALLIFPETRLRVGRVLARKTTRPAGLRTSLIGGGVFVVAAWVVAGRLSTLNLNTFGQGLVISIVLLSLVLLTGYGGQISLAQLTFVGFGAFAMGKVAGGGSPLGVLAAIGLTGVVGAVAALPALRLRGLYLALATFAFGAAMTPVFFNNNAIFGVGGALKVDRVLVHSDRNFVALIALAFAAVAVGVLAIRRSEFGRRLIAMSDSQVACVTLGMSLTVTKLGVFAVSAAIAGLAGALFGGLQGSVGSANFDVFLSLGVLLLLAIWGVDSIIAVFLAGMSYALMPEVARHIESIPNPLYVITGLGAIGLGRRPDGALAEIKENLVRVQALWRGRRASSEAEPEPAAVAVAPQPLPVPRYRPAPAGHSNGNGLPAPAVEVIGLRAAYGRIEVVHGVDLAVPPATVFALLGPNGAGKSTLLKVIAGLVPPSEGCVHIAGVHVNGAAPEGLSKLGVCTIPEGRSIFANLTVAENLRMMSYRTGADADAIEEQAYDTFSRLGERREQLAGTLSGGEQQMLAMARAVSTNPKLLLLDELSMGLAPRIVSHLYEHVAALKERGLAIIVVEQFAQMALSVADYAAVMTQGTIKKMGETADITAAVSDAYMGAMA